MRIPRISPVLFLALSAASAFAASEVQVTYECQGNAKAYFHRLTYDGMDAAGQGFVITGSPKTENTELAILNSSGLPEFLVHPAMSECGCFPDDYVFVTQFAAGGPRHSSQPTGTFHFALADGNVLTCKISLSGLRQ